MTDLSNEKWIPSCAAWVKKSSTCIASEKSLSFPVRGIDWGPVYFSTSSHLPQSILEIKAVWTSLGSNPKRSSLECHGHWYLHNKVTAIVDFAPQMSSTRTQIQVSLRMGCKNDCRNQFLGLLLFSRYC